MSMQRVQGVLLFLVLVVNSAWFRILRSYTLLITFLMHLIQEHKFMIDT